LVPGRETPRPRLASALVRALDVTLSAGAQGEDVRWFADRAAFLEQWLIDLLGGRVNGRWEYRAFAAADRSIAVRTRAEDEPDDLVRALQPIADDLRWTTRSRSSHRQMRPRWSSPLPAIAAGPPAARSSTSSGDCSMPGACRPTRGGPRC